MPDKRMRGVVNQPRDWTDAACPEPVEGAAPYPLDHVNRQFYAPAPNRLRVSNFTYVAIWAGFVYVAFVIDT